MNEHDDSMADLLKGTIRDFEELVRGEVALAKAELRQEMRRAGAGAVLLLAGAAAAAVAGVLLLLAAAWGVVALFDWPVWAGLALVGVLVGATGFVLLVMGRKRLNTERHMPRTVDTMKENLRWMRARTS
ncbi:MAG: phage holin family protein [Vicinamibacterales bacterium]